MDDEPLKSAYELAMEKLKAQVALCNSELNLQLFPDDEEHIVAYLNETYYKFR